MVIQCFFLLINSLFPDLKEMTGTRMRANFPLFSIVTAIPLENIEYNDVSFYYLPENFTSEMPPTPLCGG